MIGLEALADGFDAIFRDKQAQVRAASHDWAMGVADREGMSAKFYVVAVTGSLGEVLFDFAGGIVGAVADLSRFGEGIRSGTIKGWAQDGLRILSVAGPAVTLVRTGRAALALGGPMSCTISSSAKAMAMTGHAAKPAVIFEEFAGLHGGVERAISPGFAGLDIIRAREYLRMKGVELVTHGARNLKEVARLASRSDSPVLFGFEWHKTPGFGAVGAHAMLAYRTVTGRVRFADQLGRTLTLAQLEAAGVIGRVGEATIAKNTFMTGVLRNGHWGQVLAQTYHYLGGPVLDRIEAAVREKTGRAPPGEAAAAGRGGAALVTGEERRQIAAAARAAAAQAAGPRAGPGAPLPNLLSPTLEADAARVLKATPRAPDTVETATVAMQTGLTFARIGNAWLYLSRIGLVQVAAWAGDGAARTPAMASRLR
jgi:hypothetical protein